MGDIELQKWQQEQLLAAKEERAQMQAEAELRKELLKQEQVRAGEGSSAHVCFRA